MKMYQCRLSQNTNGCKSIIQGYIHEKGAKIGNFVEVEDQDGLWQVDVIDDKPIEMKEISEKQRLDRNSLPSLKE